MGKRRNLDTFIGGYTSRTDAALAKFLAARAGVTVSALIRQWLHQEAQKALVPDAATEPREDASQDGPLVGPDHEAA
jgi:hypothetical protein